jgi:hypothetical protein
MATLMMLVVITVTSLAAEALIPGVVEWPASPARGLIDFARLML